jgi:hypothetical protein
MSMVLVDAWILYRCNARRRVGSLSKHDAAPLAPFLKRLVVFNISLVSLIFNDHWILVFDEPGKDVIWYCF